MLMSSAINPPSHLCRSHRNRRCPPSTRRRRASSARAEKTAAAPSPPPAASPPHHVHKIAPARTSPSTSSTSLAVPILHDVLRGSSPGPRAHPISLSGPPAAPRQGASALLWSLYLPCHPPPARLRFVAVVAAGHSSPPLPPECWVHDGTSKRAPPCFLDQVHGFTPSPADC
jgi:hypothetical protein